jgi:hypothetical protein
MLKKEQESYILKFAEIRSDALERGGIQISKDEIKLILIEFRRRLARARCQVKQITHLPENHPLVIDVPGILLGVKDDVDEDYDMFYHGLGFQQLKNKLGSHGYTLLYRYVKFIEYSREISRFDLDIINPFTPGINILKLGPINFRVPLQFQKMGDDMGVSVPCRDIEQYDSPEPFCIFDEIPDDLL